MSTISRLKREIIMSITIESIDLEKKVFNLDYEKNADQCPFCHYAIEPIILKAFIDTRFSELDDGSKSRVIFKCPRNSCGNLFIGIYELAGARRFPIFVGPVIYPMFPKEIKFSDEIKSVSNDFANIYNQAFSAEKYNLQLIVGPGYRKSLEFLVKDYALGKAEESKKNEILTSFLGNVIEIYIKDPRIKSMAKRAAWLGNDETHYLRKWGDKDLGELKTLIELTVKWIEMSELSDKYEKEMPE
jgi:hypothetical protein